MTKEVANRLKSFKKRMDFTKISFKIWNGLCRDCKITSKTFYDANKTARYEHLCPKCQAMAKGYEEELNNVLK